METNNTITEDEMLENSFPKDDSKNFTPHVIEDEGLEDAYKAYSNKHNEGTLYALEFKIMKQGAAWQREKDKVIFDKLIEALKPLANLDLAGVNGDTVYQRNKTKIMTNDILKAKELLQSLNQ